MLKKLIFLLSLIFLGGCGIFPCASDYENYCCVYDDISFKSLQHLSYWVLGTIRYERDLRSWYKDYWQTPEETLARGAGDCEDKALLFLGIACYQFGVKGQCYSIKIYRRYNTNNPFIHDGNHAIAVYNGVVWEGDGCELNKYLGEPSATSYRYCRIRRVLSYEEAMLRAHDGIFWVYLDRIF